MSFTVTKFKRQQLRARIAMTGPSGAGKTLSGLMIARGLAGQRGIVACINTEPEGPQTYAGRPDVPTEEQTRVIEFSPPYRPKVLLDAINHAVTELKATVILVDSLSHFWNGKGGALEMVDDKKRTARNEFTAWGDVSKEQDDMIEALVRVPCHLIVCMRSKMEYVLETNDKGKQVPKKVGLGPIQRDGVEYEFMVVFDCDRLTHHAKASKDRTGLFSELDPFLIVPQVGSDLNRWLESGEEIKPAAPTPQAAPPRPPQEYMDADKSAKLRAIVTVGKIPTEVVKAQIMAATGGRVVEKGPQNIPLYSQSEYETLVAYLKSWKAPAESQGEVIDAQEVMDHAG